MYPNIVMVVYGVYCVYICMTLLFDNVYFLVVKVSFDETSYSTVEGSSVLAVLVTDRCFEGEFEVDLVPTLISAEGMICVCMYVHMYVRMCDCGWVLCGCMMILCMLLSQPYVFTYWQVLKIGCSFQINYRCIITNSLIN